MQFTDLISTFLGRLGYSEQSTIYTVFADSVSGEDFIRETPAVLVLSRNKERVIGVFLLADKQDDRSTRAKYIALQRISRKFDAGVGLFIISHVADHAADTATIEFHKCVPNGHSTKISIKDFPSYSELWLMNSIGARKRQKARENDRSKSIVNYAYFFAALFLVLAVSDMLFEQLINFSYLSTQRALLILAAALLLFVPSFIKKSYTS